MTESEGQRKTDTLTVFPSPQPDEDGKYYIHFFSHGVRHLPKCAIERINNFKPGEKLWLADEFQNLYDCGTLVLNTEDHYILGYCPRYLNKEIFELLRQNPNSVEVRVERVNQSPALLQFRLLCNLTAQWNREFCPFSSQEY